MKLYDTKTPSTRPMTPDVVAKRTGWAIVAPGKTDHAFTGDTVFANDKLIIVIRLLGRGAEVYAPASNPKLRVTLIPLAADSKRVSGPASVKLSENAIAGVIAAGTFATEAGKTVAVTFRLTTGDRVIETRPGAGATGLFVDEGNRFIVVPEFFSDDLVMPACPTVPLPTENCILGLSGEGETITVCTWPTYRQDVRMIRGGYEVGYAPGNRIHVSVLTGKGIWRHNLRRSTTTQPARPPALPFVGRWRAGEWMSSGGRHKSVEIAADGLLPKGTRWVGYPLERTSETPMTALTVMDIVRRTLGVGPCQYILAAEGLGGDDPATPDSVARWIERLAKRKRAAGQAAAIKKRLDAAVAHAGQCEKRAAAYRAFANRQWDLLLKFDKPPREFLGVLHDIRFRSRRPAGPSRKEEALAISIEIKAWLPAGGSLDELRKLTARLRAVSATLDRDLADGRMCARWVRVECRSILSKNPNSAPAARMLADAEKMLAAAGAKGGKE